MESLIEKLDGCANTPENSLTLKLGEHIPCGYSMSTIGAFNNIENKHTLYGREDCIKKFCEFLREHAKNIIDFEKKKMLQLTKEELKLHQDARNCYICGEKILQKLAKTGNYRKVRDHCYYTDKYRGATHSLKFNVPNEIPVVFHSGSDYDYHFVIKQLATSLRESLNVLGKIQKSTSFSVSIEKEVIKTNKDDNESVVTISYKIKFIDSARFMATSLSNLVDNLTEGIHKIKCKDYDCFLEYESVKDNLMKYKSLSCSKNCPNKIHEKLKKRFRNTFKFFNNDINKFIFYMDEWEKFNETS